MGVQSPSTLATVVTPCDYMGGPCVCALLPNELCCLEQNVG